MMGPIIMLIPVRVCWIPNNSPTLSRYVVDIIAMIEVPSPAPPIPWKMREISPTTIKLVVSNIGIKAKLNELTPYLGITRRKAHNNNTLLRPAKANIIPNPGAQTAATSG